MSVMCFSIDCPERTGGKCWFDKPMTVKDKLLITRELKRFIENPDYEVSEEFNKLLNINKKEIFQ